MRPPKDIEDMIDAGAIFYVSTSGGKDSLAMYETVKIFVPFDQIALVHAHLGEMEWEGVIEHIETEYDHPLSVVTSDLSLLEMVKRRGKWFSPATRYCTSDTKRNPIEKFIRADLKRRGKTLAVNCVGLRAEESKSRAAKPVWSEHKALTNKSRRVLTWHPILRLTTEDVFQLIRASGKKPHWAYSTGNSRLSCVFCMFGSKSDLRNGARERPELLRKMARIEREIGHTLFTHNGKPIGITEHIYGHSNERQSFAASRTI